MESRYDRFGRTELLHLLNQKDEHLVSVYNDFVRKVIDLQSQVQHLHQLLVSEEMKDFLKREGDKV